MLSFRNDYGKACIPEIVELLKSKNANVYPAFGHDIECQKAAELIHSKMPDNDVEIHFTIDRILANITLIHHILKPYEAVITVESSHIASHEVGAVEATGHKVIEVDDTNGKITPQAIQKVFDRHMLSYEHMVYPKLVYIANATELGTVYTRQELEALRTKCNELGLYLMMDGARLSTTLMCGVDYTLNDIPKWCDVFTIGATKIGGMFGEAIVVANHDLRHNLRFVMNQSGSLIEKGWLIGLQYQGLFEDDAYYKYAKHEIEMAHRIQEQLTELGYPLYVKGEVNLVFPMLTQAQFEYLSTYVDFEVWYKRDDLFIVRIVTSWNTTEDEVKQLCEYLKQASEL